MAKQTEPTPELYPHQCPFCGHDGELLVYEHGIADVWVACCDCGAHGPIGSTMSEACGMWNHVADLVNPPKAKR